MELLDTLKEQLTFSRRDQRAILFLTSILCLILLSHLLMAYLPTEPLPKNDLQAQDNIEKFRQKIIADEAAAIAARQKYYTPKSNATYTKPKGKATTATTINLQTFNPNHISEQDALSLGFPPKAARNISSYLAKGGKFYKPEDLKKIYGLTDEAYNSLLPFIDLPKQSTTNTAKVKNGEAVILKPFDPNTVTKVELIEMGIDPKTAATWQKFIAKGGKFTSKAAVKKIYGLKEEDYNSLAPYMHFNNTEAKNDKADNEPQKAPLQASETVSLKPITPFNPNTISAEELIAFGVAEKTARTWNKYTRNGGKFYRTKDLKKIYGLTEADFNKLKPFVQLDDNTDNTTPTGEAPVKENNTEHTAKPEAAKPTFTNKKAPPLASIDINAASNEDWQSIPGIGKSFAKWIVEYRERLGGFISKEQLLEVYRMDQEKYASISPYLKISENVVISKINLNTASFKDILKHPYLEYEQVKVIVNTRQKYGPYTTTKGILQFNAVNDAEYQKLKPYLTID